MSNTDDPRVYAALVIPSDALDRGGVEILRAGLVDDHLNVHALRGFDDPKHWGAILAEIAEHVADLYATEAGRNDALAMIQAAFVDELGVPPTPPAKPKARAAQPKARGKSPTKSTTKRAADAPKAKKSSAKSPTAKTPTAKKPTAKTTGRSAPKTTGKTTRKR